MKMRDRYCLPKWGGTGIRLLKTRIRGKKAGPNRPWGLVKTHTHSEGASKKNRLLGEKVTSGVKHPSKKECRQGAGVWRGRREGGSSSVGHSVVGEPRAADFTWKIDCPVGGRAAKSDTSADREERLAVYSRGGRYTRTKSPRRKRCVPDLRKGKRKNLTKYIRAGGITGS